MWGFLVALIRDRIIRFLLSIASNMLPDFSLQVQITDKIKTKFLYSVLSERHKKLLFLINKYNRQMLDVKINV